jgi:uncharacterized Cys-rich domain
MNNWQEELFGCFSNTNICLWGWCIPCGFVCLQAVAVEKATGGESGRVISCLLFLICGCIGGAINRRKIRNSYGIDGSLLNDLLIWWLFGACAGCQEYREVSSRELS